jgi:hypothetical protein
MWRKRRPEEPDPPRKNVLGIFLNGIKGGPLYPEIARLPFSDNWSLLEELQDSVERDRRSLLNAKDVSGGYPSGDVDATLLK